MAAQIPLRAVKAVGGSATALTEFQDGDTISATWIGTSAVTASKIAASAVITAKINAGAVTSPKLGASAVTATKIAASAITFSKIASSNAASGRVLSYNPSSTSKLKWVAAGTGGGVSRLAEVTETVTHATSVASTGCLDSVDLGTSFGSIVRLRVYASLTAGQLVNWTGYINNGSGLSATATSFAYDGGSGTLDQNDYIQIDNEILKVTSNPTTTPLTCERGKKGTLAEYHDDNTLMVKCNHGLRISFYPDSNRKENECLFTLRGILTGKWTNDAAVSTGAHMIPLDADPTLLPDFGEGDLILIDDTADDLVTVQSVFGNVANATYDYSLSIYEAMATHVSGKPVYRVLQFDVPIPFALAGGTVLYYTVQVDQKIAANVPVTMKFLIDDYT